MDDPLLVRGFERLGEFCGDRQRVGQRDRAARDPLGQVLALDEFHDQRRDAVGFFGAVDRGDMWMIERGEQASLAVEAVAPRGIDAEDPWQHLDRDVAAELRVVSAIDLRPSRPRPGAGRSDTDRPAPPARAAAPAHSAETRQIAQPCDAHSATHRLRAEAHGRCHMQRQQTHSADQPGVRQGVLEDPADLPPPFGRHAQGVSVNRVYSRARATCHS